MRAIVLTSYGEPDVLTLSDVPQPACGPEDVVVDVVATALNRADLLQRRGLYPEPGPPRQHEIPGMELSGRVASVGERVSRWSPGDEVMAIVREHSGAYGMGVDYAYTMVHGASERVQHGPTLDPVPAK